MHVTKAGGLAENLSSSLLLSTELMSLSSETSFTRHDPAAAQCQGYSRVLCRDKDMALRGSAEALSDTAWPGEHPVPVPVLFRCTGGRGNEGVHTAADV